MIKFKGITFQDELDFDCNIEILDIITSWKYKLFVMNFS